jgi:hypothetical protein
MEHSEIREVENASPRDMGGDRFLELDNRASHCFFLNLSNDEGIAKKKKNVPVA